MSDLGPEARAVVEAGRAGDDPAPADRARVRAAVMSAIAAAGASVAVGAGPAAAAGAKVGAGGGLVGSVALGAAWKALVVGVGVITLGAGVLLVRRPQDPVSPRAPAVALPDAPASAAPAAAAPISSASPIDAPVPASAEPMVPAPARPATRAGGPPPRAAFTAEPVAPPPRPEGDSLAAETRHLGEAHGALENGDPARALALLDEQSTVYASGQLREERAAARILALCKLGRTADARALAAAFLAETPRSPLADRVRTACPADR